MRKVQLYIARSLDGFIADRDGGIAWLEPYQVEGEDHGYRAFLAEVGAIAMGARTYEIELGWDRWPYEDRPTFVFTHGSHHVPPEADVRFLSGPVADALPVLDRATARNVFLVGGADLVRQFLEVGALDELHLFVAPVLLGDGIPLFPSAPPREARLLGTQLYSTGIAGMQYALEAERVGGP